MTYTITSLRLALLTTLLSGFFFGACSENQGPKHTTHYFYPVWSPDGKFIVAGHEDFLENDDPDTGPNIAFRDAATSDQRVYRFPFFKITSRYWIEPTSAMIAQCGDELRFYSLTGTVLGSYTNQEKGLAPVSIDFDPNGNAFLWIAHSGMNVTVGKASYNGNPWTPTSDIILLDTVFTTPPTDIVFTSDHSYAINLGSDQVLEFDFTKALLSQFMLDGLKESEPWRSRMRFYKDPINRRLYTIDDSGLVLMDLNRKSKTVIIVGSIAHFDITPSSPSLVIETMTGDVWLHASNLGTPLGRLGPHSRKPALSPDGKILAAVGEINAFSDSLKITRFSN